MRRNGFWATWVDVGTSGSALGEPNVPNISGPEVQTPVASDPETGTSGNLNDDQWLRSTSAFENRSAEIAQTAQNIQLVVQDIQESARLSRLTQLSTPSLSV